MPSPLAFDSSHYAVVSAMITPAFFLTAASALLASSNARLARVVDRMRVDIAQLKTIEGGPARIELEARVAAHRKRSRLVLAALRMLYASLSAFVGTSIAIAADSFVGFRLGIVPTLLAVLGVLLMFGASLCLGREAKMSLRMLDQELDTQLARGATDLRND